MTFVSETHMHIHKVRKYSWKGPGNLSMSKAGTFEIGNKAITYVLHLNQVGPWSLDATAGPWSVGPGCAA
jgi:hypothetical protein